MGSEYTCFASRESHYEKRGRDWYAGALWALPHVYALPPLNWNIDLEKSYRNILEIENPRAISKSA